MTDRNRPATVGPQLRAPAGYDLMAGNVTISPDGRTLAAGTRRKNDAVILWDISDPKHPTRLPVVLKGPTDLIENVRFSPDGRLLAVASDDATIHLWRMVNPRQPELLTVPRPDSD